MADVPVRSLERALAAGEESARVSLAAAYLRQGRAARVVELLTACADLPAEGHALHDAAWRQSLSSLEPTTVVAGARGWERLLGWIGDGRYAVFGTVRTHILDVERGAVVEGRELRGPLVPILTTAEGLLAQRPRGSVAETVWVRPPVTPSGPWFVVQAGPGRFAGSAAEVARVSPDGRRVLIGRTYVFDLERWAHARAPIRADTADVDWQRGRLAWWGQGRVFVDDLEGGGAPRIVDVLRHYRREHPARAARAATAGVRADGGWRVAGPADPTLFRVLEDGRLCLAPPLAVIDLAEGTCRFPLGGHPDGVAGPVRLSADRRALLLFRHGRPLRVSLDSGPPAERAGAARAPGGRWPGGLWHPSADVAVTEPGAAQPAAVRSCDGTLLRELPRGARALGWSPDGRALLLVRGVGAAGGVLEVWRAGGEV